MTKIQIDPVTRIEGHLKLEAEVTSGQVVDAWSSGTLYRGIETILKGRIPEEAWLYTQRLCGVCTYVHGSTSVRCVENAYQTVIPDNARIIRNLLMGGQFIHDHLIHFYQLHLMDWVDVVSATTADASATAALAKRISPNAAAIDFSAVKTRLQAFVGSGQLGIFANGYWGHSAYLLSPEENLLLMAHYLETLKKQIVVAKMHAIWGGKNPHLQSLRVGGVTCGAEITTQRIGDFKSYLQDIKQFIDTIYIPDAMLLAKKYSDWGAIGGSQNFLAFGEFPTANSKPESPLFPQGVIMGGQAVTVATVDTSQITEHVRHSWYSGSADLAPSAGATQPGYTTYDTGDKYSWLKAPRYAGKSMEVGPLARMLVAFGKGTPKVVSAMNSFFTETGANIQTFNSTVGRMSARALETQVIVDAMWFWVNALSTSSSSINTQSSKSTCQGVGFNEAPRGALGHWIDIAGGKIGNYQIISPTGWNCSPRCGNDIPGPLEKALVGTPVADAAKPLEILRTVHSFDPCLACAVHVLDPHNDSTYIVRAT